MKKRSPWIISFLLSGLLVLLCGQPATSASAKKTPALKTTASSGRAEGEQKWDDIVTAAKKEGSVALYTLWTPNIRVSLTQAFKSKYNIDLQITPFSRGSDFVAKVKAEQRSGLFLADLFGAGATTFTNSMKPGGLLGPIEPSLILPEAIDPKYWQGEKIPFADKDKQIIGMVASMQNYIAYNTALVKEGEITTYKDLLNPKYKGKITLSDPRVTGVGNAFISHLGFDIWNEAEASTFLKQLLQKQEVVIQRDDRINVESVAKGKYWISLGPRNPILEEFLKAGAPLAVAKVKEGTAVTAGSSCVALPKQRPHSNSSILFLNWLLTKEGQTVFSQGFGNPSMRKDVTTEGIFPIFVPSPGEKLWPDTEERILFKGKMLKTAAKIIAETRE